MNINAFKSALSLFVLFIAFLPALAAPGDLDTTFGGTGIRRVGFGAGTNSARAVARQPDGKIVAVGGASIGVYSQFAVVRYNADGTLDTTFGGNSGIVLTSVGSVTSGAQAVVLQPDGKIIVAGYASNGISYNFALARYNLDGSLDTSFDGDGKLITPSLNGNDTRVMDVVLQPDGKIVAVGFAYNFTGDGFAVARFNPDGTFDNGFGSGGVVVTFAGTNSSAKANAVAIQPDGRITVAGESANHFAVVRYNSNGSLDTSFSGDGIVNTSVGTSSDRAYDVAVQTDGKIVIAGAATSFAPPPASFTGSFAVIRYNPNGELDSTFDGDGIVSHIAAGITSGGHYSLAIQPDGKIVAAGFAYSTAASSGVFSAVRYNPNGSLDTTFDGDGVALTPAGGSSSYASAVVLHPDGKIVAAGNNYAAWNMNTALVRYKADGSPDEQFGTGGIVSTDYGDAQSVAYAVAIQPDGKIIAAGENFTDFALVRFNVDGTLDTTFGTSGKVKTSNAMGVNTIRAIALQPDGKIVVAGRSSNSSPAPYYGFALARYNPNGSLDTTFDGDGIVITQAGISFSEAKAVAVQPDGKIVAGGDNQSDFATIRYNSDGSLDTNFDGDGIVITSIGNADVLNDIALQPDGKIVAAGYTEDSSGRDSAVARYNPDGSLDTSFSGDGKVVTPMLASGYDYANGVVVQPDGKIITAGQATLSNGGWVFGLVRYNSDGSPDNTFDSDGIVITSIPSPHGGFAEDVALQPDGKIVAAGNFNRYELADFAIVRYNPNGSLDNTFGSFGKAAYNIGVEDNGQALALDSLGRIIVAGSSGGLLTVIRVNGGVVSITPMFDYDGDGKADISVFRPSVGDWYFSRSSDGAFAGIHFGASGDLIAPADFDGDRKTDICVFRPSTGSWYLLNSSNNSFTAVQFGANGDLPVPGDFDGDRRADLSVYRPSAGSWYRLNSSNNQSVSAQFGIAEDKPIVGDFDGDGKSDLAVFRPSNGTWYRINSSNDSFSPNKFGIAGDLPVAADYDGDGKSDLAVYRPSNGTWYYINSSNSSFVAAQFGITEDKPAPADFDGDGRADLAVFRQSSGTWYLLRTTAGFTGIQFGANGDIPTPNAFVR